MGSLLRSYRSAPHLAAIFAVAVAAILSVPLQAHIPYAIVPILLVAVILCAGLGGSGPGFTAAGSAIVAIVLWLTVEVSHFPVALAVLCFFALSTMALTVGMLHGAKEQAENALRERDLRLQLLSQQIPGGLWSTDADLNITSCFGSQSELLSGPPGSNLRDWFGAGDPSFTPLAAHRRACAGESNHYELSWRGRTFQCQVDPLRDEDGRIIGVIGVGVDITERKRGEQILKETRQQLEQASRAKDHFLATLSHELRTPLTPVLALTGCLEERDDLPAGMRQDLSTIRHNVELEARLIDDLLDLTRITTGKLTLELKPVDLHRILRHTLEVCRHAGRFGKVHVVLELGASNTVVRGDPARLEQVFWNLVKNSIKFTPDGGSVRIVTSNPRPGEIAIQVIDTGIGIAAEMLPHIFEPFEQGGSHVTQQFGGLGLGLAITKAIVEGHGGSIGVSSEGPGKGACFSLQLAAGGGPAAVEPSAGETDEDSQDAGEAHELGGLRILLVDDHEDTARVMARLLSADGSMVTCAFSLAQATEALAGSRADLLISDIGLPDGSGCDLMQVAAAQGIPGIALSGYGADADQRESLEAGFAAHLTKPVPVVLLRRTIAQVIAGEADPTAQPRKRDGGFTSTGAKKTES